MLPPPLTLTPNPNPSPNPNPNPNPNPTPNPNPNPNPSPHPHPHPNEVECHVDGKLVKLVGTGEYFGERALLTAEPRSADVLARTGVSLVSLTRQEPPTLNPKP